MFGYLYCIFLFFISFTFSFVVSVGRDVLVLVNLRSRLGKVTDSYYPIKTAKTLTSSPIVVSSSFASQDYVTLLSK